MLIRGAVGMLAGITTVLVPPFSANFCSARFDSCCGYSRVRLWLMIWFALAMPSAASAADRTPRGPLVKSCGCNGQLLPPMHGILHATQRSSRPPVAWLSLGTMRRFR